MQKARTLLENLLTRSELETAINGCILLHRHYGDPEGGSATAQLSARYHALMAQQRDGTISQEEYRLERARINRAMLDLVQKMPADWTDAPLADPGFSNQMPKAAPQQKRKWGLALALSVVLLGIAGFALRERIFPTAANSTVQSNNPIPEPDKPVQQPQQSAANPSKSTEKPAPSQERTPPSNAESSSQPNIQVPAAASKSDSRFRSFGKTVISDGMERGKVGEKMAFRNVQTGEILCCFADAEDFSAGKAYVSKDGVNYFYINKQGQVSK
jgi:hypothetical protein